MLTYQYSQHSFHCLFCHGYEERGAKSAGVLATGFLTNPAFSAPVTRMAGRLAEVVNVYTNGNESLASELRPLLKNTKKFHIINDKISSLAKDPEVGAEHTDILVSLEGGAVKKEGFMVSLNPLKPRPSRRPLGGQVSNKISSPTGSPSSIRTQWAVCERSGP